MRIAPAEPTEEHLGAVLGLIEDARSWLWTKDTDQWAKPWPSEKERDARVFEGLQSEKTWIVWDGHIPAGTVTVTSQMDPTVWATPECGCKLAEPAIFMHRLITARKYSGLGLGAQLIDWVGLRGKRLYDAKWIRIDVWRTNRQLHEYYLRKGFEACGFCADAEYPSSALFQKPVAPIREPGAPLFLESPDQPAVDRGPELSR